MKSSTKPIIHRRPIPLGLWENGESARSNRPYGERESTSSSSLHNYSTRSDSLDLRVVDVPKLICTTYQLKEQMNRLREEQGPQAIPLLPSNGDLPNNSNKRKENPNEQELIRTRIEELEQELNRLRGQLGKTELTWILNTLFFSLLFSLVLCVYVCVCVDVSYQ